MKRIAFVVSMAMVVAAAPAARAHPGHSHWLDIHEAIVYDPADAADMSSLALWMIGLTVAMVATYAGFSVAARRKRKPSAIVTSLAILFVIFSSITVRAGMQGAQPKNDAKEMAKLMEAFKKEGVASRSDDNFFTS